MLMTFIFFFFHKDVLNRSCESRASTDDFFGSDRQHQNDGTPRIVVSKTRILRGGRVLTSVSWRISSNTDAIPACLVTT